jgi:hypothetical protein
LWDVVGSFGIPISGAVIPFQQINFGHQLSLPDCVRYCFHAMALDERRQTFRITRIPEAYDVWFRGVHSDIGGGNGNIGLSHIALRWMLRKAHAAGLPIAASTIAARDEAINPMAQVRPSKDLIPNEHRGLLQGDRFHYTVTERPDHNNAPSEHVRESERDEGIAVEVAALPQRQVRPAA